MEQRVPGNGSPLGETVRMQAVKKHSLFKTDYCASITGNINRNQVRWGWI